MKVVSFIPIKLNNQRLPGKNLLPLDGKPLCTYLFDTISKVNGIDEKYVFCSDDSIQDYMPSTLKLKKRDPYLDGFQVKGLELVEHFVRDVDADIYVLAHCTQPFMKAETIEKALSKVTSGEYDSAFSCVEMQDYMWYEGKPFTYDMKDIIRTQDLEPVYVETGAIFIFRKEVFTKLHQRIGEKPYFCNVDKFEAIDIDDEIDFKFAETAARYLREKQLN